MKTFENVLNENKERVEAIKRERDSKPTGTARNLAFGLIFVGSFLLAIMFAAQIITGIFALVLTVVVGVGGVFGLRFLKLADPMIKQKMKNKVMKEMINEARKNAVEELQNLVLSNKEKLDNARKSRNKMDAKIEQLRASINPDNKGTPIYEKKLKILERVEEAFEIIKKNVDNAAKQHKIFEQKVKDYKDLDSFSQIADEAMAFLDQNSDDMLQEMLSLEAFDSIDQSFSESIIAIENRAHDMKIDEE